MSVPMKRHTRSKVGKRRSHDALSKTTLNKCPQCGKAVLPHTACSFCGTYRGKQILVIKDKAKKNKKEM